jgi:crotonobetainyl-CoA:carnitine CoA-transferase CaiB-like acyl-CoA transferase
MEGVARGKGPLEALTVIDVTHMLAGPYCTWVLGALGLMSLKLNGRTVATIPGAWRRCSTAKVSIF